MKTGEAICSFSRGEGKTTADPSTPVGMTMFGGAVRMTMFGGAVGMTACGGQRLIFRADPSTALVAKRATGFAQDDSARKGRSNDSVCESRQWQRLAKQAAEAKRMSVPARVHIHLALEAAVDEHGIADGQSHSEHPPHQSHGQRVVSGECAVEGDVQARARG